MPELVLKLGDQVVQRFVVDKDIISIGRSRDNDVMVENLSVSRNHGRIRRQGGKFVLTDLNSANGTFVNGVRVSKTEIVDGDVVSIGKHKIEFVNKPLSDSDVIVEAFGADRTMVIDKAPVGMLCVTEGKLRGKEFSLTKFETTIGKASANDIVIADDWFLSRKQAVISRRGNEFEIKDLGGFRKTRVNGTPLSEPLPLKPGDILEFGNTRCVFQLTAGPVSEAAT
jgi:pSer/pThr/pTyr-binding forkhead associated (FHA) protein